MWGLSLSTRCTMCQAYRSACYQVLLSLYSLERAQVRTQLPFQVGDKVSVESTSDLHQSSSAQQKQLLCSQLSHCLPNTLWYNTRLKLEASVVVEQAAKKILPPGDKKCLSLSLSRSKSALQCCKNSRDLSQPVTITGYFAKLNYTLHYCVQNTNCHMVLAQEKHQPTIDCTASVTSVRAAALEVDSEQSKNKCSRLLLPTELKSCQWCSFSSLDWSEVISLFLVLLLSILLH